jgi:hypothetical protein
MKVSEFAAKLEELGSSFEEYLTEQKKSSRSDPFEVIAREREFGVIINLTMAWGGTSQGHSYWDDIHEGRVPTRVLAKKGEAVPDYEVLLRRVNVIVGCQTLEPRHQRKLIEVLTKHLEGVK